MFSSEGERIPFIKCLKARGSVEVWLGNVEAMMKATVQSLAKRGMKDYPQSSNSVRPSATLSLLASHYSPSFALGVEASLNSSSKRGLGSNLGRDVSFQRSSFTGKSSRSTAQTGMDDGGRTEWLLSSPCSQIVLVVSQVFWCLSVEERLAAASSLAMTANAPGASISAANKSLSGLFIELVRSLEKVTEAVRGKLSLLQRKTVVALVTLDVHNRDIVDSLIEARCCSKTDFAWQMQLRYEYDADADLIVVRQVNARFEYGYEVSRIAFETLFASSNLESLHCSILGLSLVLSSLR